MLGREHAKPLNINENISKNGAIEPNRLGTHEFHEYVVREKRPSYRYQQEVRVGTVLPESGVTYYDVPPDYHVSGGYRYTIVNDRPVLVDPASRRVVDVLE